MKAIFVYLFQQSNTEWPHSYKGLYFARESCNIHLMLVFPLMADVFS